MKEQSHHKATRIALYNHKGGVGKTILTANIASTLAYKGKRVLVVDSDPQCNITSYFIEDRVVDSYLDESDSSKGRTIWTALKPIVEAEGTFKSIAPHETEIDGLYLLPGDIRLAEYEESLNVYWGECLQRRMRGFKGTNSLSALVNQTCKRLKADYVFYDTGPNIGPLNRVILLDCDYFIVPAACDLFSLRAMKSLGHTLADWIQSWDIILSVAPKDVYMMPGTPKFLGYIPQRFRVYGGKIARIPSGYISRIERVIYSDIVKVLRNVDKSLARNTLSGTRLGEVKDFSSLVQQAQSLGVPLYDVTASGADSAWQAFSKIADSIIKKVESG